LYKPELDKDGKPVMENGKAKMVSQSEDVAKAIGTAWLMYQDAMTAKNQTAKPEEFRAYLEAHEKDDAKNALALSYLNQIRDLLSQIRSLGITPTEYEVSRNKLLSKLRFAEIEEKDFPLMIDGPSSRPEANTVANVPAPVPAATAK
jgi:hypothetical protein